VKKTVKIGQYLAKILKKYNSLLFWPTLYTPSLVQFKFFPFILRCMSIIKPTRSLEPVKSELYNRLYWFHRIFCEKISRPTAYEDVQNGEKSLQLKTRCK